MNENNFNCIYCGELIADRYKHYSCSEHIFICYNHLPTFVRFYIDINEMISTIKLAKDNHYIYIYPADNFMEIFSKSIGKISALSVDKSLTPENLSEKLKLYLTFQ